MGRNMNTNNIIVKIAFSPIRSTGKILLGLLSVMGINGRSSVDGSSDCRTGCCSDGLKASICGVLGSSGFGVEIDGRLSEDLSSISGVESSLDRPLVSICDVLGSSPFDVVGTSSSRTPREWISTSVEIRCCSSVGISMDIKNDEYDIEEIRVP